MPSAFASSVQCLVQPPSVEIFVVSELWSEPTRTVRFFGDSREAGSFSTAVQSYTIYFRSCTLLLSKRILCSSVPVKRFKPEEFLQQSHCFSPQHLLLISAPNEMASSGVPHLIRLPAPKARGMMRWCSPRHALIIITPPSACKNCYFGESFYIIKGYTSSPICFVVQPVHSDVTSFSLAAPFISSSCSLGGVQVGDGNPSNITIWAWPIKDCKKVSPLHSCLIFITKVSKFTFMWGSLATLANLLIIFSGFIEIITETDMHTAIYLSYTKRSHSFRLLVGSPEQSTSLSSFSQEMRVVSSCASFMKNVSPPNTKWRCVSLSIAVLSSCVAVRLGPEDATDIVSTIFRGADWILMSLNVTKSQVSGIALSLAPTHSSHASNSLSFYFRGFSTFNLYVFNACCCSSLVKLLPDV